MATTKDVKDIKGFCMYPFYRDSLARLSDCDRGQLLLCLFDFWEGVDTSGTLSPAAQMAFAFITDRMEKDLDRYRARCRINRENAAKRWPVRTNRESAGGGQEGG